MRKSKSFRCGFCDAEAGNDGLCNAHRHLVVITIMRS